MHNPIPAADGTYRCSKCDYDITHLTASEERELPCIPSARETPRGNPAFSLVKKI